MGGAVHVEVEDQARKFVPLSNAIIYAIKKDNLYAEILQRGIKDNKFTINKSLKEILKVAMQKKGKEFRNG